jgi:PilZ domain
MNKQSVKERRKLKRRNISYYLPVWDNTTRKVIGQLIDINTAGLMIDSKTPIQAKMKYSLHVAFMEEVAGKPSLELTAQCKWCRPDPIQHYMYNVGFEIVDIAPEDLKVIQLIAEKYGAG